jgi:hypothetical protein
MFNEVKEIENLDTKLQTQMAQVEADIDAEVSDRENADAEL